MSLRFGGFGGNFSSFETSGLGTNGFEVSLNYITGVPDPNILTSSPELKLIFKALLKRDDTTREKSIQELLNYIQSHKDELNDDLLIITWCQLYSKLSIDNSKKVRATSHQIQSQFVLILGKKFAKYLKDTIGCWLSGTFDSDRLVSKSCISSIETTFNSKEKISALWKVFTNQILNYSFEVLVLESKDTLSDSRFIGKDETEAKYLRVVLSSVQLFSQVLLESSSQNFEFSEDSIDLINKYLSSEQFQDLFTNRDLYIKKSIYQSFKILCSNDKSFDSLDPKIFSQLAKASVKGLKIGKNVNPILYSSIIITILDCMTSITKYSPSFWISVKKSEDRLLGILKIGSLNSNPIYYDIVSALLLELPKEFLGFDDYGKLSPYLDIIRNDVATEKLPDFVTRSWKCYLNIIIKASYNLSDEGITQVFTDFSKSLVKLLDSPRKLNPQILKTLSHVHKLANSNADVLLDINFEILQNLPSGPIEFSELQLTLKYTEQFITNFVLLLASNNSELLETLFTNTIESLQDEQEEYKFPDFPELAFTILYSMFHTKTVPSQDQEKYIEELIRKLPDYTTDESSEKVLGLLILLSKSDSTKNIDIHDITGSIFGKLKDEKVIKSFLNGIKQISEFDIGKCPVIHEYLAGKLDGMSIQEKNASNDDVMFKFVSSDILSNLYKNISTDEQFTNFVKNSNKYYKNDAFVKFAFENDIFVEKLVKSSKQVDSRELLSKLEKNVTNEEFERFYVEILRKSLSLDSVDKIHSLLVSLGSKFVETFLPENLFSSLTEYISPSIDSKLSISNPLGSIIYMFELSAGSDCFFKDLASIERLFSQGLLYLSLLKEYPSLFSSKMKLMIEISLIAELASDFTFLQSPSDNFLVDFKRDVHLSFISLFKDIQFIDFVNALIDGTSFEPLNYLLTMLESSVSSTQFYSSRLLVTISQELINRISINEFEAINFSKFSKYPLRLALLLLSANQYLTCKNLDRVRNQTGANLIGLKDSKSIMTTGVENLILLNLFMDLDLDIEIPSTFQVIPAQRFMMILSSLSNWSDCDSAYDEEFAPSRIVLMEFVEKYIKGVYYVCDSNYPQDFIGRVTEIGYRVCSESLNLVSSEMGYLSLAYSSLKLFNLIKEYKGQIELWDESVSDVYYDIVKLFLRQSTSKTKDQAAELLNEVLSRVIVSAVPIIKVKDHYENLYNFITSPIFEIQNTSVVLLHKLIPQVQDELVIEATLSKPTDDDTNAVTLPSVLVENVTGIYFDDYLEHQNQSKVNAYLYSWYLIMDHFKSITQKIRQDYINDLGEDLIQDFLTFLFKELDLSKSHLTKDDTYVTSYELPKDQFDRHSENTKLVVHLLYLSMKNFGGNITQTWFNSIRDKQLKQSIEKFLVKSISPLLINEILESLVGMDSLQDSEFKIKLNKNINEIKCFYEIDEQKLEIAIGLPANYPLSQILVNGVTRLGVDEKKWKSWILACQYVINIQNGTIMEAIKHFKNNVKMNFENYDDCAICYSILNAVDHSTPNKVCSTCKHNFHSACLYRWFKSSGSSTCPLCRAKFQFKKHS